MLTQYTVYFPHLANPAALSRNAKCVKFVVNSFRCSCGSSSSSASVFAHNSISSLSSSPRQSVISSTSHINWKMPVFQPVLKFFCDLYYSRPFGKFQIKCGGQHEAPAVLLSVILTTTNGTEHWVFQKRLWKFWEVIKFCHTLGFTPRTVHPLVHSIHPLRSDGSIQHCLQVFSKFKLIIQQEIQRTVASICWHL